MASASSPSEMHLSATYASPTNAPFTLTHALTAPASGTSQPTVPDKTAYLAALRNAAAGLQEQINKELTQRMNEDNAANGNTVKAKDEDRAEANYGEEAVEDDE